MTLIDGKAISEQIKQEIATEVAEIVARGEMCIRDRYQREPILHCKQADTGLPKQPFGTEVTKSGKKHVYLPLGKRKK